MLSTKRIITPSKDLLFDGYSNYAEVPYSTLLNPDVFTIDAEVVCTGGEGTWRDIICSRMNTPAGGFILRANSSDQWTIWVATLTGWSSCSGGKVILNKKTRVTASCWSGNLQLFVDGYLVASSFPTLVKNTQYPLRIGAGNTETTPSNFFPGKINVRLYNRTLTSQERLMNKNGIVSTNGLIAEWKCNDGTGSTIKDTNSIYNATLSGSGLWGEKLVYPTLEALNIPTYDGNPNTGHPSILYVPEGWNGFKYWMAFTPYPAEARENPSIVASNDGYTWVVPNGLTNPIFSVSEALNENYAYNSDPDIIIINGTMFLYNRMCSSNAGQLHDAIYVKTSADGVHWSPFQKLIAWETDNSGLLSPSVIQESDGSFTMYTMWKFAPNPKQNLYKRTSLDGYAWSDPVNCHLPFEVATGQPWHFDVVKGQSKYYLLFITNPGFKAFLVTSDDGINWNGPVREYLQPHNMPKNARGYYRTTFLVESEMPLNIRVWATLVDNSGVDVFHDSWRIATQPIQLTR